MQNAPPAPASSAPRSELRTVAPAALGLAIFWSIGAGMHDLHGPDETRYVQIAQELLQRDNWFVLTLNGELYNEKPPLPFWIWAGLLRLNNGAINELMLRMPGILAGVATLVLTWLIGRHLLGAAAAQLATVILLASPLFLKLGPLVRLDMMYTGWLLLALWAWLTRPQHDDLPIWRAVVFWLALTLAFFTKGPVGWLIVACAVGTELRRVRSRRLLAATRWKFGLPVLLAAVAVWFVMMHSEGGHEFVWATVYEETVHRFAEGDHGKPFHYYFPRLFTAIFPPWALVLIPAGRALWTRRRRLPDEVVPLLGWVLIPFLFFCLANGKRQSYLLPLLPAMAMLVAWHLAPVLARGERCRRIGHISAVVFGAATIAAAGAAMVALMRPDLLDAQRFDMTPARYAVAALVACGMGALAWLAARSNGRGPRLVATWAAAMLLIQVGNDFVKQPAQNRRVSSRAFSRELDALLQCYGQRRIGGVGDGQKPEFHVYGSYAVVPIEDEPENFVRAPELPPMLVGETEDWEEAGATARALGYEPFWSMEVDQKELVVWKSRELTEPTDAPPPAT